MLTDKDDLAKEEIPEKRDEGVGVCVCVSVVQWCVEVV